MYTYACLFFICVLYLPYETMNLKMFHVKHFLEWVEKMYGRSVKGCNK